MVSKKSICGVALQLRRCSDPGYHADPSVSRLASGAFYETIFRVTIYEIARA